jgi:hypothetical protein
MDLHMLKAFVLCENITDSPANRDQKDLQGAGLSRFKCVGPLPVKLSFWVFAQMSDEKESGEVRLALMRRFGPALLLPSHHHPTQGRGASYGLLHSPF